MKTRILHINRKVTAPFTNMLQNNLHECVTFILNCEMQVNDVFVIIVIKRRSNRSIDI